MPGTAFLVAPIVDVRDQGRGSFADSFSSSSYAGERGLPRNYVFLDPVHETFQRLMSWNGWRILGKTGFPPQNQHGMPGEPTEWFVYEIVKADTNGDGHWDYGDELTIAVSDAAGRDFTEVLSKVERVHSTSRRDPSTLLVVYRSQARAWIARVDMKTRKVVNTSELPSFGPDVR